VTQLEDAVAIEMADFSFLANRNAATPAELSPRRAGTPARASAPASRLASAEGPAALEAAEAGAGTGSPAAPDVAEAAVPAVAEDSGAKPSDAL